jgi:uncharacterized protein (TIGR02757 family)
MLSRKQLELKNYLDEKVEQFNCPAFIANDPIQLPHLFNKQQDIEIIALFISTIAWGNRTSIIRNGEKLIQIMQEKPFQYIQNTSEKDWNQIQFVHRTFNNDDLHFFFLALKAIYTKHTSLEALFCLNQNEKGIEYRISNFRNTFFSYPHLRRSEKHLSNPLNGSAAKRLNMFLRWMVRKDDKGVDFGCWKDIKTNELHIPLDVHTANIARKLGLLTRKQNDWKAVQEIQRTLLQFDPKDPAKYDFALFGLGVKNPI